MVYSFKIGEQTIHANNWSYMPKLGDVFAFNTLDNKTISPNSHNWLKAKKVEYAVDKIVIQPYVELENEGLRAIERLSVDEASTYVKIYLKPITENQNTD